ncbi:hypothetical protein AR275_21065 [Stenotrophomonas maltophilia]|nr:hypothetical protein AR275_21065 [Stenotrophomonas maltophilia]
MEAAAYVDSKIQSDWSGVENNTDAIDFLRKNQNKYDWGTAFDSSDRDNFSKFSEELGRETGYFKDVYTAISGTAYAAGSTKDWRFEFQEPLRYYGDASRSQKGVAMVQAGAAALGIGAAAAVEFGGWCILNPYSCGRAASGAIDAVMGDYVGGHSLAPVLPALVAAKAATTAEQTLRLSSGAVGAEIAGNAAKKGGLQSEQVLKPMQAAGADVAEAGAKAGASEQSSLANLNRLSPQEEAELLKRQLIQAERHDPWIGTTLPGAEAPVTVTAEATVGGRMLKDTNQTARPTKLADADHPTLVADLLPPGAPNSSMKSAHAEIAVIQRAYEQGLTNAQKMLIVVRGEGVCSYCQRSDNLIAAAQRSGLSKLEIIDVERNTKMVWNRGEKSFFEVTLHE